MKKLLIVAVIFLLSTSFMFAGGAPEEAVTEVERLTIALSPTAGETHRFWTAHNWEMVNPALESLVGHDPVTGEFVPSQLAESWSHNEEMNEWTFRLRDGVEFHHGWGEVTADDVVHSYELQTGDDSAVPGVDQLRGAEVTALDSHTVRFTYEEPRQDFLFLHGGRAVMLIYSKAQYEAEGLEGYDDQLVGTGHYQFVERSPGEILFERVENHYSGETADFAEYKIVYVQEASTRLAMLRQGEAHIAEVPRELHPEVTAAGLQLISSTGPSMQTNIALNGLYGSTVDGDLDPAYNPDIPWTDVRVREAMNRALDRHEMVDVLFDGRADLVTAYGMGPGHLGDHQELHDRFDEWYGFDPDRAQELLDEAGYPEAFAEPVIPLIMMPLSGQPEVPVQTELVQGYLEDVGFQTEIIEYDTARVGEMGRAREAYIVHPMRNAPIRPTQAALQAFYTRPGGPYQGYESDRSIGYFEELRASLNPEDRERIAREAFVYLFEQYSSIPLFEVPTIMAVNPDVVSDWTFPGVTNAGYSHYHLIRAAR